jgi:hypothetical protein
METLQEAINLQTKKNGGSLVPPSAPTTIAGKTSDLFGTLAKNELLAMEGTYQWDGTDEKGS